MKDVYPGPATTSVPSILILFVITSDAYLKYFCFIRLFVQNVEDQTLIVFRGCDLLEGYCHEIILKSHV